jgi:DnaJ-domain-containing protein 1
VNQSLSGIAAVIWDVWLEQIARSADKSGMHPYWLIDEASFTGVREVQPEVAAAQPDGDGTASLPLANIRQMLGDEAEPDVEFFVESWTVGVAAASENFLRRQQARNRSKSEVPWQGHSFFTSSFFAAQAEVLVEATLPLREARTEETFIVDQPWTRIQQENEWRNWNEFEALRPLTLESARQVLGVEATSAREQVRAAYHRMATRYHPDRLAGGGASEQHRATDRMALINEAYRLLCAEIPG